MHGSTCLWSQGWEDGVKWITGDDWPVNQSNWWAPGQWETLSQKTHTKGLLRKDTQGRSLVSTQCLSMFSSYAHTHKSFSKALGDFRAQSCCFNQVSASWYRGLSPHSLLYFSTDVLLDTWGQALGDSAFGQCQMLPALPSSGHHSGWGRCQLRVSKLSNVLYYAADMYVCTWFLPAVWRSNASL